MEKDWFDAKNVPDTLKAMGIAGTPAAGDITITSPDIAENGAVVPVGIASKLQKTEMIALLVEKNPAMMAGFYEFASDSLPDVSMRVKMGQSSDVIAIVKADGKFFMAKKKLRSPWAAAAAKGGLIETNIVDLRRDCYGRSNAYSC